MTQPLTAHIQTGVRDKTVSVRGVATAQTVLIVVMVAALWLALLPLSSVPAITPADAPSTIFSAARAMQDLAVIAASPRPAGSPQAAVVRDFLMNELRKLGLEPEIQRAVVASSALQDGLASVNAVENVLVRVPGTAGNPAVLISGHYDSVPTSTGAADCGACTATVLETLRAVLAGPRLRHDVIFLFTDGEEIGVAGARAFMQQHAWAKDVGLSLVFEGYGDDNASMLYVAGKQDGWFVGEALAAMPAPLAYSLVHDLMWRLAGNTGSDLDAFLSGGAPGLGFLNLSLATSPVYHTLSDSVANLDPRTLQQHGDTAQALVRHFANLALDQAQRQPNLVYFAVAPSIVVRYPGTWAWPLAMLPLVVFIGAAALGLRRRQLSVGGMLAGVGAWIISLVAAIAAVTLVWWLVRWATPALHQYRVGGWYGAPLYLLAFVALTLAVYAALYFMWRRRFSAANLAAGALAVCVLLAPLVSRALPGFSYVFTWPALLSTGAMVIWLWRPAATQRTIVLIVAWGFAAMVCLVLIAPAVYILAVYSSRLEAMLGIPMAALPVPFLVLALGLLQPLIEFLAPPRRSWLSTGALFACFVFLVAATVGTIPDATRPQTNTVYYLLDASSGRATWITVDDSRSGRGTRGQLDEWTAQFFPDGGEQTLVNPWLSGWFSEQYPALQAPAPVTAQPATTVTVLEDITNTQGRHLRLHLMSPPEVLTAQIVVSGTTALTAVAINGKPLDLGTQQNTEFQIDVFGRHAEGVTLDLWAPARAITLTVQDRLAGLPQIAATPITPRPGWLIPAPFNDAADSTIVRRSINF